MRTGAFPLLTSLLVVATHPGPAAADEVYCQAYARAAYIMITQAAVLGCGYAGHRWSPIHTEHIAACKGWGDEAGKLGLAETESRAKDLSVCKAKKAGRLEPQ